MCCVLFLEQHPRLNLVTKLLRMLTSGQQLRLRGTLRKGLRIQASQRVGPLKHLMSTTLFSKAASLPTLEVGSNLSRGGELQTDTKTLANW